MPIKGVPLKIDSEEKKVRYLNEAIINIDTKEKKKNWMEVVIILRLEANRKLLEMYIT